jgi:hypothetical protein
MLSRAFASPTGVNDFRHQPNFCLRALKALYIEFAPRPT